MKLGQMVSYLDQGLPEHVREALAELQQDAPPMSGELAAQAIADELGAAARRALRRVGPGPDRLGVDRPGPPGHDPRRSCRRGEGAVPRRRSGGEQRPRQPRPRVRRHGSALPRARPQAARRPSCATRLVEELDYEKEAANQQLFADHYRGHPFIHVPDVDPRALARRGCSPSELAEGVAWAEMLTWNQDEKNLAAETLYRFAFGSLYRLLAFNGDPHPGNYLFRPGGQVTFLDYGLVKHFTAERAARVRGDDPLDGRRARRRRGSARPSSASGC